jgi:hypothetical protein
MDRLLSSPKRCIPSIGLSRVDATGATAAGFDFAFDLHRFLLSLIQRVIHPQKWLIGESIISD